MCSKYLRKTKVENKKLTKLTLRKLSKSTSLLISGYDSSSTFLIPSSLNISLKAFNLTNKDGKSPLVTLPF